MNKDQMNVAIQRLFEPLEISVSEKQFIQIYKYYTKLVEWNKVMNLTAITDADDFLKKHIYDSLLITKCFSLSGENKLIDVGTGAGFPGIPLKIFFPDLKVTLLDSLNKRINFLNEVIGELGLTDIRAIHGRAEDFGKMEEYREAYDLCVSRAVSQLNILSEYCIPFVRLNGYFIAYKSTGTDKEIAESSYAIECLGGSLEQIKDYSIENEMERRFVLINKVATTPEKYPRKAGKPQKSPLIAKL